MNNVKMSKTYILILSNGKRIEFSRQECIVGRKEVGAKALAGDKSIACRHMRVTFNSNGGLLIENISTNDIMVDGQKIPQNIPVKVAVGMRITLGETEGILAIKEDMLMWLVWNQLL